MSFDIHILTSSFAGRGRVLRIKIFKIRRNVSMQKKGQDIYKGYYSSHTASNIYTVTRSKINKRNFVYALKKIMLKIIEFIISGIVGAGISLLMQYFISL